MSGIDRSSGHIGQSDSARRMSTLSAVGGAAFNVVASAGTVAANIAGGPVAGQAVAAAMSGLRSGASSASGGSDGAGGAIGDLAQRTSDRTEDLKGQTGDLADKSFSNQIELFQLQQAVNSESQAYNTMSNIQKSKHDAAMAAIQNTR